MNRKPNPKLIGAFMTGSLLVLTGLVLFFGSASYLRQSTRFILFFDQSVNGLSVGSPVKFRGVPIGAVESILIRVEGQDPASSAIPVIIRIDQDRIINDLSVNATLFDPESIQRALDRGLLARLNLESFITGQLFVELSFEPDRERMSHLETINGLVEIPTRGSPLEQITGDIAKLLADVGKIDLGTVVDNLNTVLVELAVVLEGIDSKGMSASVSTAADEVTRLMRSEEFKATLGSIQASFESIRKTVDTYNLAGGPMAEKLDAWTAMVEKTLGGFDGLVSDTGTLLDPRSDFRYELENTLRELSRAARSIRLFADYLERNPNAILTGRPDAEE